VLPVPVVPVLVVSVIVLVFIRVLVVLVAIVRLLSDRIGRIVVVLLRWDLIRRRLRLRRGCRLGSRLGSRRRLGSRLRLRGRRGCRRLRLWYGRRLWCRRRRRFRLRLWTRRRRHRRGGGSERSLWGSRLFRCRAGAQLAAPGGCRWSGGVRRRGPARRRAGCRRGGAANGRRLWPWRDLSAAERGCGERRGMDHGTHGFSLQSQRNGLCLAFAGDKYDRKGGRDAGGGKHESDFCDFSRLRHHARPPSRRKEGDKVFKSTLEAGRQIR
jgi:hypothetical protein